MYHIRILLTLTIVLNFTSQAFAIPLVPGYTFHESFESETAITLNSGIFTGTTIVPGFLGNAIDVDNTDKLTYTKTNIFNSEEGTVMFWASPNYNLLNNCSKSLIS